MCDPKVHYDCTKCKWFVKVKFVDEDIADISTYSCVLLSQHKDCDYEEEK